MNLIGQFHILSEDSDCISCIQMFIPGPINHIPDNHVIYYIFKKKKAIKSPSAVTT